jgi:hypothetical protein
VGVVIWAALEAFRRGDLEPQVLAGKHGWHTIQMQDGRLVRLGLKRPDADTVEVHLLKVMKRR